MKVKTLRWHVEKRALERIGHVLRMSDSRSTKTAGKETDETKQKINIKHKQKTILYWKKLLKESGIEWTTAGQLAAEREQ